MVVLKSLKEIKLYVSSSPISRNNHLAKLTLQRDNYYCQKCSSTEDLQAHHIIPIMYGGINHLSNMITLCSNCHQYAPDTPYEFFKWIKKSCSIKSHTGITLVRMFSKRVLSLMPYDKFNNEIHKKTICEFIKFSNLLSEKAFNFRNKRNVFENDLIDLESISNFIFNNENYNLSQSVK